MSTTEFGCEDAMESKRLVVTDFGVLLRLASNLAIAEKSGNLEHIESAKKEHDEYRDLCLKADRMNVCGMKYSDLL